MTEPMLNAREAARFFGISVRAFYSLKTFDLRPKIGRGRKWSITELRAMLERARFDPKETPRAPQQRVAQGRCLLEHEILLTRDCITANKTKFPYCGPAIYFLFCGDELVYIGQTINLLARVGSHFGRKDFDHFSYIVCERDQLGALERSAILKYRPKLNLV